MDYLVEAVRLSKSSSDEEYDNKEVKMQQVDKLKSLFPDRDLSEEEIKTLPLELQEQNVHNETKIEFFQASKVTKESYLIRAIVIDNLYKRYEENPRRAKLYSIKLISIAHGTLAKITKMVWLSGYRNLGKLLNNPERGNELYDKLVNSGWSCYTVVKNSKLTHEDYITAINNWNRKHPQFRKSPQDAKDIRELAGKPQVHKEKKPHELVERPRRIVEKKSNKRHISQIYSYEEEQPAKKQKLGKRKVEIDVELMRDTLTMCMNMARESKNLNLIKSLQEISDQCRIKLE